RCQPRPRRDPAPAAGRQPPAGRSPRPESSRPPDPTRGRAAGPGQPHVGRRHPRPEPSHGRVIVWVDLVLPGPDIDGDELAVVLGAQRRPDAAVEDLGPKPGEFLRGTGWFSGRHGQPPGSVTPTTVPPRADPVTVANPG